MTRAKKREATIRAGALAMRLMREAETELAEARGAMHTAFEWSLDQWRADRRHVRLAITDLRATRLLYDKLPRYAK